MPGNVGRVRLIVVVDELDLAAEEAALSVGFLFPDLGAGQCLLAVRSKWTGHRQAKADRDRIAALRRSGVAAAANAATKNAARILQDMLPDQLLTHAILPKGFVL